MPPTRARAGGALAVALTYEDLIPGQMQEEEKEEGEEEEGDRAGHPYAPSVVQGGEAAMVRLACGR